MSSPGRLPVKLLLDAERQAVLRSMTGYGQPDDVRRALDAGFDRHLKKPVRLEDLERTIGELDLVG